MAVALANVVIEGNRRKLTGSFRIPDETGMLTDADTVRFKIRTPSDVLRTYVLGVDPEVTRDSVGKYIYVLGCDEPGEFNCRVEFELGDEKAADEDVIVVLESEVLDATT
jgi:hypothetical protein